MQGGSQAIIDTLVKGLEKNGGTLSVKTRARRVLRTSADKLNRDGKSGSASSTGLLSRISSAWQSVVGGSGADKSAKQEATLDTAVAVEVIGPDGCPKVVRVGKAVISNASVWDTERILTTTGEINSGAAMGADERVLQKANLVGKAGGKLEPQMSADVGGAVESTAASQTALLERESDMQRRESFDTQSMNNPAVWGDSSGQGVFDSMGSIDSDDWSTESCEWQPPAGQDGQWLREDFLDYVTNLEMNSSFMHLHVGFEAREGVCHKLVSLFSAPGEACSGAFHSKSYSLVMHEPSDQGVVWPRVVSRVSFIPFLIAYLWVLPS